MTADQLIECLRQRRIELRMSQARLAERTGYSLATVKHWETGRKQPRLRSLCDWCGAINLDIELKPTQSVQAAQSQSQRYAIK